MKRLLIEIAVFLLMAFVVGFLIERNMRLSDSLSVSTANEKALALENSEANGRAIRMQMTIEELNASNDSLRTQRFIKIIK